MADLFWILRHVPTSFVAPIHSARTDRATTKLRARVQNVSPCLHHQNIVLSPIYCSVITFRATYLIVTHYFLLYKIRNNNSLQGGYEGKVKSWL